VYGFFPNNTTNAAQKSLVVYNPIDTAVIPGVVINIGSNPNLDAEIPYYQHHLFEPTLVNATHPINIKCGTGYYMNKAFGDDASMHFISPGWLLVPGAFHRVGTAAAIGFGGLQTFMT